MLVSLEMIDIVFSTEKEVSSFDMEIHDILDFTVKKSNKANQRAAKMNSTCACTRKKKKDGKIGLTFQ